MRNRLAWFIFVIGMFSLTATAEVSESYLQSLDLKRPAKSAVDGVDVFLSDQNPSRPHVILGNYTIESDGTQTQEKLMEIARSKAAELGADFIKIKLVTSHNKVTKRVGGVAFIGFAASSEIEAKSIPKIVFSFGAYNKSSLGIVWDTGATKANKFVVSGFRSYSLAEKNGLKQGDEILEINGMLLTDKRLQPFIVDAEPGTILKLFVKRDGASLNLNVPTAPVL